MWPSAGGHEGSSDRATPATGERLSGRKTLTFQAIVCHNECTFPRLAVFPARPSHCALGHKPGALLLRRLRTAAPFCLLVQEPQEVLFPYPQTAFPHPDNGEGAPLPQHGTPLPGDVQDVLEVAHRE